VPSKHVLIGKVVKVTDGDTITVLTTDNEQERIRLWGIDAPESRGNQPYWKASRDQLAKLVAGTTVTVTWDSKDRNGRILGWVMVDEGI
jgi:endonuclease YncB( thermonuclease family)